MSSAVDLAFSIRARRSGETAKQRLFQGPGKVRALRAEQEREPTERVNLVIVIERERIEERESKRDKHEKRDTDKKRGGDQKSESVSEIKCILPG